MSDIQVVIKVQLDDSSLYPSPFIRYCFLDGSRPQSVSINEWPQDELGIKSFTTNHNIKVDDTVAYSIHTNPYLQFFIGDLGNTINKIPARYFLDALRLDISPLLLNHSRINHKWCNNSNNSAPPPKGFQMIEITILSPQPFLNASQITSLNPLNLTIEKVVRLPGIVVDPDIKSAKKFVSPDKFALLKKYTKQPYICFNIFNSIGSPRIVRSFGNAHGSETIKINHSTAFLASAFDKDALTNEFEASPIVVELHDRDILESNESSLITLKMKIYEDLVQVKREEIKEGKTGVIEVITPLNLPEIETLIQKEWTLEIKNVGNSETHGIAKFFLQDLLSRSNDLRQGFAATKQCLETSSEYKDISIRLCEPVIPHKRRVIPKGGIVTYDLSEEQLLVRQPGGYLSTGTAITLSASLARSIWKEIPATLPLPKAIFERAVFLFEYNRTDVLELILSAMQRVNSKALPGVSLRSYQLTDQQKEAANNGTLDIIGGFQVLDDEFRLIVVEGLNGRGMNELQASVPRTAANNAKLKIFKNSEVRFPTRIYTQFDVALKMIRLRDPLSKITKGPEIYNRSKVSGECFKALDQLASIKVKVGRLYVIKALGLFPLVDALLEIESKYGETITMADMEGLSNKSDDMQRSNNSNNSNFYTEDDTSDNNNSNHKGDKKKILEKRKGDTDSKNPSFELYLSKREIERGEDYIRKHYNLQREIKQEVLRRRKKREEEYKLSDEVIYMYSGQKLNHVQLQKEKQRITLAQDKDAIYTYSQDFQSLTIDLVNMSELQALEKEAEKKLWTTKTGFKYPAPKSPRDFIKVENDVSESRKEDLKQPWTDSVIKNNQKSNNYDDNRPDFNSIPEMDVIFGGFSEDEVINGVRVPSKKKNPDYFKSVHLCGDGLAAVLEEAEEREKQEWKKKVIVDDLKFRALFSGPKPAQSDRMKGILKETPRKKGIKMVQVATLPSGRKVPLLVPPVSMFSTLPKEWKVPFQKLDTSKFTSNKDFIRVIHPDEMKGTGLRIHKRVIPPMRKEEMKGKKWGTLKDSLSKTQ